MDAQTTDRASEFERHGELPVDTVPAPVPWWRAYAHAVRWGASALGVLLVYLPIVGFLGIIFEVAEEMAGLAYGSLDMVLQVTAQAAVALTMYLWHTRLDRQGFVSRRVTPATRKPTRRQALQSLAGIFLLALGIQLMLEVVLSFAFALLPTVADAYTEHMDSSGLNDIAVLPIIATVLLAPLCEEAMDRGVVFEYCLRATCPRWSRVNGAAGLHVTPVQFWIANALQALLFGALHFNIVQVLYAAAAGMVLGWVYWRCGRLRYSIALHLCFNLLSYFLGDIMNLLDPLGRLGYFDYGILAAALLFLGYRLFTAATPQPAE